MVIKLIPGAGSGSVDSAVKIFMSGGFRNDFEMLETFGIKFVTAEPVTDSISGIL